MLSISSSWQARRIAAVVAVALVAGCDDDSPPVPDIPELVVATGDATAADCPYGGTVVRSGLDSNRNQVLDDAEVRNRTAVCNAAPAQPQPRIVIRLVAEPRGDHCAEGGTGVQSGPDGNGNGALDDDEVSHTDFVCGDPLTTRFRAEPEGVHCVAGGIAFQVGHDRNHDDVLDDDEVEHTDFTCGDLLARSITVGTAAEVAALAGVRVIDGSLTIEGLVLGRSTTLPALQHVLGSLKISSALGLTRFSAPALVDVQATLSLVGARALTELDLPSLTRVGGPVHLSQLGLTDLGGLPALATVGGRLTIDNNASLTSVALPSAAFRIADDISISDNPGLRDLSLKVTDGLSGLRVSNNGALSSLTLSMTGVASRGSDVGSVLILDNPLLATATIEAAQVGWLDADGNQRLTEVVVRARGVEHDVEFRRNDSLQHVTLFDPGPSGRFGIGGSLTIWSPVATLDTNDLGMPVALLCSLVGTNLADLKALSHCGVLELGGNARLTTLSGVIFEEATITSNPELASIRVSDDSFGTLLIRDNPRLASVELFAERLDGLTVEGNTALRSVHAPMLTDVSGSLSVDRNSALDELSADHLLHIADQLVVANSTALTSLSLPALVSADKLFIAGNAALNHVALDALDQNTSAAIDDNPRLPTCSVDALFARLPGTHEQHGNDDTTGCGGSAPAI